MQVIQLSEESPYYLDVKLRDLILQKTEDQDIIDQSLEDGYYENGPFNYEISEGVFYC